MRVRLIFKTPDNEIITKEAVIDKKGCFFTFREAKFIKWNTNKPAEIFFESTFGSQSFYTSAIVDIDSSLTGTDGMYVAPILDLMDTTFMGLQLLREEQ